MKGDNKMTNRLDDDRPVGLIITPMPKLYENPIAAWFRKIFGL